MQTTIRVKSIFFETNVYSNKIHILIAIQTPGDSSRLNVINLVYTCPENFAEPQVPNEESAPTTFISSHGRLTGQSAVFERIRLRQSTLLAL